MIGMYWVLAEYCRHAVAFFRQPPWCPLCAMSIYKITNVKLLLILEKEQIYIVLEYFIKIFYILIFYFKYECIFICSQWHVILNICLLLLLLMKKMKRFKDSEELHFYLMLFT